MMADLSAEFCNSDLRIMENIVPVYCAAIRSAFVGRDSSVAIATG